MRPVIFGTAGHIDHGKTALTERLTGTNTDRLPEERARGISIDLGFAHFVLPNGQSAAIIDVPGHERFVRHMVAGVHGIDAVMLVVAADEGVMPQTREHLDILQLLGVKRGLVVLTKLDTVEADWLALVEETVVEALQGTFLEKAPILAVDSLSGNGFPALMDALVTVAEGVEERRDTGVLRLPIDRVFTVKGFGTVVTGTLVGGRLRLEDAVELVPPARTVRVRGLQVHGAAVSEAVAGQRVAVNVSGVEREEVARGMVLATPRAVSGQSTWVVEVTLLPGVDALEPRTRVHVHTGTAEALGRITGYGPSRLDPGATAYAELLLETPLAVLRGDRFLIRSYSPMVTIGGGRILEVGVRHRHKEAQLPARLQRLAELLGEDPNHRWQAALWELEEVKAPLSPQEVSRRIGVTEAELLHLGTEAGAGSGVVMDVEGRYWVAASVLEEFSARAEALLLSYHQQFPLHIGMPRDDLRRALVPKWELRAFDWAVGNSAALYREREWIRHRSFQLTLSDADRVLQADLLSALDAHGLKPEPLADVIAAFGADGSRDPERLRALAALLVDQGDLIRLEEGIYLTAGCFQSIVTQVRQALSQGPLATSALRDALGTSRRFAVPILELLDQRHITRRIGETRQLVG